MLTFNPITQEDIAPQFEDETKTRVEQSRIIRKINFATLGDTTFNPYVPYSWGYTVFRAVPSGHEWDDRFAAGTRRLNDWMRWDVRRQRYYNEDSNIWRRHPTLMPQPGQRDATDDMADRLWNEVITQHADQDQASTRKDEGSEDFSSVGRAFISWVSQRKVNERALQKNVRFQQCLVLDEAALESLESLPAETPTVRENLKPTWNSWVWILDRETMKRWEAGETIKYPPWIRMRLCFLYSLWFDRPLGLIVQDWQSLVEEDKVHWDKIYWWNPQARTFNEVRRAHRAREEAGDGQWRSVLDEIPAFRFVEIRKSSSQSGNDGDPNLHVAPGQD